ncbi:hypothetical protein M404DRAFT_23170 [Pisolithus tinctorius Marx 270]|uniref:Uncharacterized protein n=1 Tax=Pisolithus tinctorius Marx 270 TaxID=870435 RepID=A0A0C3PHF7_PISTI|nr:hypothetical protein M404DRAFT_23170 [Pisolithus tinctorius Marx 270]
MATPMLAVIVVTIVKHLLSCSASSTSLASSTPPPIPAGIEGLSAKIVSALSLLGYSSMEHVPILSSKTKAFAFASPAIWYRVHPRILMLSGFPDSVITASSVLGDLTILTGGTIFTDELGVKLEKSRPDLLDSSGSIIITKEDTVVLNSEVSKDIIQARCEQIRTLLADPSTSEYDKSKLQERFAKLSDGAAVIKADDGGDVDVGEKKDMYDYPLNAERAAVEEGILPGSGVASLKASLALATNTSGSSSSPTRPHAKVVPYDAATATY